jgi:hypothetical protein
VQIANLDESHQTLVAALPRVQQVERDSNALLVTLEDPDRDNPAMIGALAAAGASIQYVQASDASLEDVYLQLVGGEPA